MTKAKQTQGGLLSRLEALRHSHGAQPIVFTVDGVTVRAEPFGARIRLSCELLPAMPGDDGDVRALMARYLPYADHGAEILCADGDGHVMLIAPVEPETDLPTTFREFCDAAVFWSGIASGVERPRAFKQMPAAMIFP